MASSMTVRSLFVLAVLALATQTNAQVTGVRRPPLYEYLGSNSITDDLKRFYLQRNEIFKRVDAVACGELKSQWDSRLKFEMNLMLSRAWFHGKTVFEGGVQESPCMQ